VTGFVTRKEGRASTALIGLRPIYRHRTAPERAALSTQWVWRTTTRTAAGTGQRDVVVVLVAGGDGGSVLVALVEDLPEAEP
jgi:hypothetical protein